MRISEFNIISELSSYKGKYILFRLGSVSTVALAFMLLADNMAAGEGVIIPAGQYLRVILVFNILTELNVALDNLFERFFPIPARIKTRVLLHVILSLSVGFIALVYFESHIKNIEVLHQPVTWIMFAFGLIFVFILIVISISLRIVSKWIIAQREVEELKQLQMKNDYNALQDQLNPHFLFNNLSVLKSMIRYDPEAAIAFTQNFTDTFRYVLQSRDRSTVPLSEELEFLRSYIELHKERLGDAFQVEYDIDPLLQGRNIPPLSLQLLIENAIKHNIVSREEPLKIRIYTRGEAISVENNYQPKETSYSTSKGLSNLKARYGFLTEKQVTINGDAHTFKVELPLLQIY
jgi:two-component system, LytTR family, sensor kinase